MAGLREFNWSFAGAVLVVLSLFSGAGESFAQAPGGLATSVEAGSINTSASNRGNASTVIGSGATGGTSGSVSVGSVSNTSSGGTSRVEIGGDGHTSVGCVQNNDGSQRIGGDTMIGGCSVTNGGSTHIGSGTVVTGDVLNQGAQLTIGGGCAGYRNGRCCIVFDNGWCVVHQVPPDDGCPPGYRYSNGLCRLYSDFNHRVDGLN